MLVYLQGYETELDLNQYTLTWIPVINFLTNKGLSTCKEDLV